MTIREPPWMCHRCGYLMDTASVTTDNDGDDCIVPADDDISLCLNCAAPYLREMGWWRPATAAEIAALPAPLRRQITQASMAVWLVRARRGTDLAKRGGRA